MNTLKNIIIDGAVLYLQQKRGYTYCNRDNVLTDEIYAPALCDLLANNMNRGEDDILSEIIADITVSGRARK